MSILRDFEKRLERGVEGFFARTFKSGLQPVELAKALQRYAGNYQQVGLDGVLVPNVYRLEISDDDMERFSGYADSLARELADVVRRTADDHGWRLQGPVRIELRVAEGIRVGTYELRGKIESGGDRGAKPAPASASRAAPPDARADPDQGAQVPDQGAQVAPVPAPAPPSAVGADGPGTPEVAGRTSILPVATDADHGTGQGLLVVVHDGAERRHTLGGSTLLGRLTDCDVTLDDPSVSRRHARIRREGQDYIIEDLRSTNGVRVNGEQRDYARLVDGDELELGSVRVSFRRRR